MHSPVEVDSLDLPAGNAFLVGCYGGTLRDVGSGQEIKRFGD